MNDARKPRKCQVLLLDERRLDILIQPRLVSCDLLDMVASHFNLHEKEYFGLSFFDETGHETWLRLDKRVLDHDLPRFQDPLLLVFCVRFFVPNIIILKEASTIELFYLQARTLIFKGSIHCDSETVFELAGYALQASCGDMASEETAKAELRRMPLLPTRTLKEHPSISYCEDRVFGYYQKSAGQTRIEAILRYLGILQSLPTYGVHYYEVKDKNSIPWWLGLSPKGVGVYDRGDKMKPRKIFLWSQIENIYFRERKFSLEIRETCRRYTITPNNIGSTSLSRKSNPSNMMVHAWYTSTSALAKTMWTMAISQHQFYLDKKQTEVKASRIKTLKEMAQDLSDSTTSIPSMSTSDSLSIQSEHSHSVSSMNGGEYVAPQAADYETLSALAARREALLEKLKEKTAELKKLCIQEAELTGEYPPETPYTPGSPLPQLRRRVGTEFDFSDFVIGDQENEDEEIKEKSFEVKIQAKITSAVQKLAQDRSVGKTVRKTHKLTYQKSVRKLRQMKDALEKFKQAKEDAEDGDHSTKDDGRINAQFGTLQSSYSVGSLLYRTDLNHSSRSLEGSLGSLQDDSSEPPSPMFYEAPLKKYPSTPSTQLLHGDVEARRRHSPVSDRQRTLARPGPAFQYSDSDRSDCSTKHSSVSSSYTNSEDFAVENGDSLRFVEAERHPYSRRIGSSWDNLNTRNKSRSPSPGPSGSRSVGQSSESLYSDHELFSPNSPGQNQSFSFGSSLHPDHINRPKVRQPDSGDVQFLNNSEQLRSASFSPTSNPEHINRPNARHLNTDKLSGQLRSMSFGSSSHPEHSDRPNARYLNTNQLSGQSSHPEHGNRPKVRYLNASDLAIVSNSGQAGSYSVTHMGSARNGGPARGQLREGHMSTSMSTITLSLPPSNPDLRTVRSHVDVSTLPYLTNPGLYRNHQSSKASLDEELLEWDVDTDREATLV